ncbi:tRNA (adenine(22)-N(1))-methyltransferase [Acetonema longum]|uniref:SAM-dependent methyltransferase n=1 Tax=Acetonema longum DSM 6540 TaxID=1009370 RepID=F7NKY9_9FIRM|nr:class I SAM-dependent methyltransferase [Acetonema longum]EGO63332.1 hypothetical protein ALO_13789 [Acetonema longum DSM 6540]
MKLRERLAAIASMVPEQARIADIGTDHAYLPIYLVSSNRISYAVASDVHSGPYQTALEAVCLAGLSQQISVRFGDGLAVLSPGEVDVVVIAGMGGGSMISILEADITLVRQLNHLILQPMVDAPLLRRWLQEHGLAIVNEELVAEEDRLYEIIAAQPGIAQLLGATEYEIGPVLWQKRHSLLKPYLRQRIKHDRRILAQLSQSRQMAAADKITEYENKVRMLEEAYQCL